MVDTSRIIAFRIATAAFAAALMASTASAMPASGIVQVVYVHPEQFTDVRDRYAAPDARREALLAQLARHLEQRGAAHTPADSTLIVAITNIDMAGEFEPWRPPPLGHIRIVKDVYLPRVALTFRLTDAGGHTVKEGRRELRGYTFPAAGIWASDPLRYEKALLEDWLERELPRR